MSLDSPDPPRVDFNRPSFMGNELDYVVQAVEGGHISGNGRFTKRCEALLEEIVGCRQALLVTSCTHALEISALLLDLEPGDEVIMPSFTFVSTANAFALRGARPVFVDIRPDTLNLDERELESAIGPRTRAIVPVHYAGVACEMEAIGEIARRHDLAVIEDNAHGLFAKYRGQPLGSFGDLATLSFHETKNVICGEGGALLVNREAWRERAEILREKGTDRARFLRGEVDKYTWVDIGSSYVASDLLAAFLLAQLEAVEEIQRRRRRVWERYREGLTAWAEREGVGLPIVPPDREQSFHMFYLLCPSGPARDLLISHLRERGILAVFHYVPLHTSPMGRRWAEEGEGEGESVALPVTDRVARTLVRLPFYTSLDDATIDRVIEAVCAVEW